MKLISKTPNGQLAFCPHQGKFHLEFGNLFFHLSATGLNEFHEYVASINAPQYLEMNKNAFNKRKLMLHLGSETVFFSLNEQEFSELRQLLSLQLNREVLLKNNDIIDKNLVLN